MVETGVATEMWKAVKTVRDRRAKVKALAHYVWLRPGRPNVY